MNLKENREWYMGEFEKKKDICYNYNLKNKRESEKGKSFSLEKYSFFVVDNVIFLRLHSIPRIAKTIGLQINMFNLMLLPKLSFLHP